MEDPTKALNYKPLKNYAFEDRFLALQVVRVAIETALSRTKAHFILQEIEKASQQQQQAAFQHASFMPHSCLIHASACPHVASRGARKAVAQPQAPSKYMDSRRRNRRNKIARPWCRQCPLADCREPLNKNALALVSQAQERVSHFKRAAPKTLGKSFLHHASVVGPGPQVLQCTMSCRATVLVSGSWLLNLSFPA